VVGVCLASHLVLIRCAEEGNMDMAPALVAETLLLFTWLLESTRVQRCVWNT